MNFQFKENVLMYNVNIFIVIPTQLQNIVSNIFVGGAYESHRVVLHTQTGLQVGAITPKFQNIKLTFRELSAHGPVCSHPAARARTHLEGCELQGQWPWPLIFTQQKDFCFRGPLQETQINVPLQEFQGPPGHEIWGREASTHGDSFPSTIWKSKKIK